MQNPRAGLAPLEFVLSLPILLFVMALMINFGTVSAWKVRTQVNARYASWRTITLRTGNFNPNPDYWPTSAMLTTSTTAALPQVNQMWDSSQDLLCPCVRGPNLTAPNAPASVAVKRKLEMDDGVHRGTAQMTRGYPMLQSKMTSSNYQLTQNVDLLNNPWQFQSLGFTSNVAPVPPDNTRAKAWWAIDLPELVSIDAQFATAYQNMTTSYGNLTGFPQAGDLAPLDSDDEFALYQPSPCPSQSTGRACSPDFYPRLRRGCSLDPVVVQQNNVLPLLRDIENLPCSLAAQFRGMYYNVICPGQCNGNPAPQLQTKYQQLVNFSNALPPNQYTNQRCSASPLQCPACPPAN